jgi:hypothetical protein
MVTYRQHDRPHESFKSSTKFTDSGWNTEFRIPEDPVMIAVLSIFALGFLFSSFMAIRGLINGERL